MKRVSVLVVLLVAIPASAASAWPGAKPIVAERKHAATVSAGQLLHEFAPPPGSVRTQQPRGYGGVLRRSGPTAIAEVVDRVAFWRAGGSFSSAVAYVRGHRPAGFHFDGEGRSSGGQTPRNATLSFSRHGTEFLNATVVQLPGRVVIRVDAQVVWIYPRSPAEQLPAAVREVDVKEPDVSRKVTDPAQVKQIVHWFDALPISPPGVAVGCPLILLPHIEFVFRSASGQRLATAIGPAGKAWICGWIQFSIHGRQQRPLIDQPHGRSFVYRVGQLLGVRLIASRR